MIGRMDPSTASVTFEKQPTAPPPAYSATNSKFHVSNPSILTGNDNGFSSSGLPPPQQAYQLPIHQHPQYGQLMNDLRAHHSSQLTQHLQASDTTSQIPKNQVSNQSDQIDRNNNNNIVVLPPVQQVMAAPYSAAPAPAPQVTAININGGGPAGPRRYRREANHLVHLLLSILFPPWIFIWCIICCCYGCPNICCCCGDEDACDNCCPKYYEDTPVARRGTTWI